MKTMVGTARCAVRTPQRGVPTKELRLAKPRSGNICVYRWFIRGFDSTPHPTLSPFEAERVTKT